MQAQRVRILRATFECIAESGIEGTSIAAIRKRAELSAGALYVHFRNKNEIIAATVQYASAGPVEHDGDWQTLKAQIVSLSDLHGFNLITVVRARLHLNAEIVRSGGLHDMVLPMLRLNITSFAASLQRLEQRGLILLKCDAEQTAINICAYIDGMLWIGLAHRRPIPEIERQMHDAIDYFVEVPTAGKSLQSEATTVQSARPLSS